jgi:hypothetical protein
MQSTIRAVAARGFDTRGREEEGLFHADLFVSRPLSEIKRRPVRQLVSVVSGANKPWRVGTKVLGGLRRASAVEAPWRRVSAARGS